MRRRKKKPATGDARLDALRGEAPTRSPNVRALAKYAANAECPLAVVGFAARVDFDRLLTGTRYEVPYGQSPFAFRRGERFEERLRQDGHAPMLGLFREHLGFDVSEARVANVRGGARSRAGMERRADQTADLVKRIVSGSADAPNLLDGAVLTRDVAGVRSYFEADAVAARFDEPIRVGEVKSFPSVDGQADPEKVGAAIAQVSIYILLLQELVARVGGDPDRTVSKKALIITPKNTGLQPTLCVKAVDRHVDRARRILDAAPDAREIADALPAGVPSFEEVSSRAAPEKRRVERACEIADRVGTLYRPGCLSGCGMSRLCRERSHATGDPLVVGGQLQRLLPGVESMDRAHALANGKRPRDGEKAVAEQLVRAQRLRRRHAGGGP